MDEQDRPGPAPAAAFDSSSSSGGDQPREGGARPSFESRAGSSSSSTSGGGRHRRRHREPQPQQGSSQPRRPEASINMDELRELVDLIAARGLTEFELEKEGFRVRLCRNPSPSQAAASALASAAHAAPGSPSPLASTAAPSITHAPAEARTALTTSATQASVADVAAATGPASAAGSDVELHIITSPIVGTFYRSPSPTSDSFVRAGSPVEPDTVVCIIEAMKLMNEILAETSGTVEEVYVENGQPVEYGQSLFGIRK